MNAIEQIASVLARPAQRVAHSRTAVWQPAEPKTTFRNSSDRFIRAGVVAKLRDYLTAHGPASAAVLKDAVGCTSSTISAVLRHDRAIGRVQTYVESGRLMYAIREGEPAVFRMIARLEALGYTVIEP
jgi:hypothetical protein